jgi:hypothetical protein
MIANPSLPAYRYNPYDKTLTHEVYEYDKMTAIRRWRPATLRVYICMNRCLHRCSELRLVHMLPLFH